MLQSRLLEAAVDQFGRFGLDGASTRSIARASGTTMSSITYHFGGKEGLYLAAADHIAAQVRGVIGPQRERAQKLAATASREQVIDLLLALLDIQAQMMLSPESEAWSRFIVREQQQPTDAFERLYDGIIEPFLETFVLLIARVRPDMDEVERRMMAVLLLGQTMVLRVGRAAVCRTLGRKTLGEEDAAQLRARLRKNALCILTEEGDG